MRGSIKGVTRTVVPVILLAVAAIGALQLYQAAARERQYRALLAKGDSALQADHTFAAIEAYSGAIALRPDAMLAHLRRGETYQRRGELDAAARDLQDAAALDPAATRPLEELGDVRYQQHLFPRAADLYRQCLRLDDRAPHVSYKLALACFQDGDIESALTALTDTMRLNESMADAYYLQGLCYQQQNRLPLARRSLEKAVALAPRVILAREELADLYRALGRRADELEQLEALAGIDPGHFERQIAVAFAHTRWFADPQEPETDRAGHADQAVLTLRRALERTPDQPLLYAALGRVWLRVADASNDPAALDKALEALEQTGDAGTAASDTLTLYGQALLRTGRVEMAERVLQQATERYPIDPHAFLAYADAAERQNHTEAARHALIQYDDLTGDEDDSSNRAVRIAQLSLRVSDFKEAVDWSLRALADRPTDGPILALLAEAQLGAGDQEAADATITRGLEVDPTNASLLSLSKRIAAAR
jgi:tetratricopeptide (TPR) repeat protein